MLMALMASDFFRVWHTLEHIAYAVLVTKCKCFFTGAVCCGCFILGICVVLQSNNWAKVVKRKVCCNILNDVWQIR